MEFYRGRHFVRLFHATARYIIFFVKLVNAQIRAIVTKLNLLMVHISLTGNEFSAKSYYKMSCAEEIEFISEDLFVQCMNITINQNKMESIYNI